MTNRNNARVYYILAIFAALFVICGLVTLLPNSSAAPGPVPDLRGNWQGTFVPEGMPVATPVGISMAINSQGIGSSFSGTFFLTGTQPGTVQGNVAGSGSVRFHATSPEVNLTNGIATYTDYGGGAGILDGSMTVSSIAPFYNGFRKFREIRPFANFGNCPCTPRVGDYIGTWGNNGSSGPIKFTVQAADHTIPTKFTSQLIITIGGQMHWFGMYGTSNGDGDVVAIAHSNTGRLTLTAVLTESPFFRPSILSGNFKYELHDGTVIEERFSATKQ